MVSRSPDVAQACAELRQVPGTKQELPSLSHQSWNRAERDGDHPSSHSKWSRPQYPAQLRINDGKHLQRDRKPHSAHRVTIGQRAVPTYDVSRTSSVAEMENLREGQSRKAQRHSARGLIRPLLQSPDECQAS